MEFFAGFLAVVVYGGLIFLGGLTWFAGWYLKNERVSTIGETMAFFGLCVDGILMLAAWLF